MWYSKKDQDALLALGNLFLEQGKIKKAVIIFEGLLFINPYHENAQKALKKAHQLIDIKGNDKIQK